MPVVEFSVPVVLKAPALLFLVYCVVVLVIYPFLINRRLRRDPRRFVLDRLGFVAKQLVAWKSYPNEVVVKATQRLRRAAVEGRVHATFWPASSTRLSVPPDKYELRMSVVLNPLMRNDDKLRHELAHHCDAIDRDGLYRKRYDGLGLFAAEAHGKLSWSDWPRIEWEVRAKSDPMTRIRGALCKVLRPTVVFNYPPLAALILLSLFALVIWWSLK